MTSERKFMNNERKFHADGYIKMLKDTEDLTLEELARARDSFNEGWTQCELKYGSVMNASSKGE